MDAGNEGNSYPPRYGGIRSATRRIERVRLLQAILLIQILILVVLAGRDPLIVSRIRALVRPATIAPPIVD